MKKEYDVKVEGVTPLLFNRFLDMSIDSKVKKRSGATKDVNVELKLYKDGKGQVCVPATWLYGALVEAGKNFKVQGKGKSTYSKLIGSTIKINPEMFITSPQTWEPYSISAVNPMTRGRMMVTRPRMNKWAFEFRLEFNEDDLPVEVIKNVLDYAGEYVGVGDWRPAKKGQFGKFIITEFKAL